MKIAVAVLLAALPIGMATALAADDMNELARDRGCYLCHSVAPRAPGAQETLPPGPAWRDIARRYKDQPGAGERLTAIVMSGNGSNPADRHWKGKARAVEMPANAIEISEADARRLVRWILSLGN